MLYLYFAMLNLETNVCLQIICLNSEWVSKDAIYLLSHVWILSHLGNYYIFIFVLTSSATESVEISFSCFFAAYRMWMVSVYTLASKAGNFNDCQSDKQQHRSLTDLFSRPPILSNVIKKKDWQYPCGNFSATW